MNGGYKSRRSASPCRPRCNAGALPTVATAAAAAAAAAAGTSKAPAAGASCQRGAQQAVACSSACPPLTAPSLPPHLPPRCTLTQSHKQEGQYSLADPTSLCAIVDARARGLGGSTRIALPAQDPDAPHHYQASTVFESKMHRLHGGSKGLRERRGLAVPLLGRRRHESTRAELAGGSAAPACVASQPACNAACGLQPLPPAPPQARCTATATATWRGSTAARAAPSVPAGGS